MDLLQLRWQVLPIVAYLLLKFLKLWWKVLLVATQYVSNVCEWIRSTVVAATTTEDAVEEILTFCSFFSIGYARDEQQYKTCNFHDRFFLCHGVS